MGAFSPLSEMHSNPLRTARCGVLKKRRLLVHLVRRGIKHYLVEFGAAVRNKDTCLLIYQNRFIMLNRVVGHRAAPDVLGCTSSLSLLEHIFLDSDPMSSQPRALLSLF